MPTISIHLPEKTCKRLTARLGRTQTPSSFGRAAIEEKLAAMSSGNNDRRLATRLQALIDDEVDSRIAAQRLARRARGESKTYAPKEAWHELGLPN